MVERWVRDLQGLRSYPPVTGVIVCSRTGRCVLTPKGKWSESNKGIVLYYGCHQCIVVDVRTSVSVHQGVPLMVLILPPFQVVHWTLC